MIDAFDTMRAVRAKAAEIEALVRRLLNDEPALRSSLDFGPMVRQGVSPHPALIICDQSGTELFNLEGVGLSEHRMALLARPGDTVAVRRRVHEFERYLTEYLGMHDVTFLEAGSKDAEPIARKLRTNPELSEKLASALQPGTPLTIHSYLTTGHIWQLAKALGEDRKSPVNVAGPGPRTSRRVNDKLWFWSLASELTGKHSVPPTLYAFGPAAAAAHAVRFARTCDSVVVKVPSSAGGKGNLRLESSVLRYTSLSDIRLMIEERLFAVGWKGTYPILVGVWESGIIASPSAQMWLPKPEDGPPRILGLFEQRVEGVTGKFSGAQPAAIDQTIAREMMTEAAILGALLQRIGYFGPCSLDAVIQEIDGGSELHWVECNGRWSGVSIPLAAARGLFENSIPDGLVILQELLPDAKRMSTSGLCTLLGDIIFQKGASTEGIVILSPPDRTDGMSVNVMVLAETQTRAASMIEELYLRLNSRVT
ncbi:preATP grasp domain-containing protein [Ovoidimarina sediminis]|uniref:preATP grasp domain-containing protein n=1 Tax=Ovoidimarina sediminis TaxID=3079856 RepID=UPI00290EB46A|nr:hypothetical protein [Rhodophyticola sp. MJ-SS7]MDU8946481.1 hypothetical protein [Rhodophyticola sp. MJ-SS7]